MNISRRRFIGGTSAGLFSTAIFPRAYGADPSAEPIRGEVPLVASTWGFGKEANEKALKVMQEGGSILDAVEQGIGLIESSGNGSVGLSGGPNAAGVVQLDACIMYGPGHKAGSVAGIEGIKHPISAARKVMEKTRHVMLVGEGARMFAIEQGLEAIESNSREKHEAWQKKHPAPANPSTVDKKNHDTIALLILGADGTIAG